MAPVIHLTATADQATPLAVVLRLSIAELLLLADRAGHPRLPLDLAADADSGSEDPLHDPLHDRLHDRLAGGAESAGRQARTLLARARVQVVDDPASLTPRLTQLGLLDDVGTPTSDVLAAFGALAAPEAMLVLDVAARREAGELRLRSFLAVAGSSVTQLSTVSGLTYELAWFPVAGLSDALTRAATVADDEPEEPEEPEEPDVPDVGPPGSPPSLVEIPWEVFTDGTEAVRRGRDDLLAEVLRIAPAPVRVDGRDASPALAAETVGELETTLTGRLRVLVTAARETPGRGSVGVITWLRTGSTWRALSAHSVDHVPTVRLTPVAPADLPGAVAPVLAQVVGSRR